MIARREHTSAFAIILLSLLVPFAYGQSRIDPNAGKAWDPITGFGGPDAYPGQSTAGSRSSSPWSFARPLDSNLSDPQATPGTIGGIVISSQGRGCGGMFRMVAC